MQIAATAASAGLEQTQARLGTVAKEMANPNVVPDTVQLSSDAVSLLQARDGALIDVQVLKVTDDVQKSFLSALA